jgi:hypothetical protein
MRNRLLSKLLPFGEAAFVCLILASATAPAQAGSIVYLTPPGSTTSGPVDAEADFTTGFHSLMITLKNLQANPTDAAQLLSDISFTVGRGTLAGATLASSSAQLITVNSNKTFSTGATVPTGWVPTLGGTSGHLDDLVGTGHAGPAHLLIGPPGGSTYANSNGSIHGNKPHNPFLNQTATFSITGPGITADTTVTSATFSFGTTSGIFVNGSAVPEPSALAMGLVGVGLIGSIHAHRSFRRRRRRSRDRNHGDATDTGHLLTRDSAGRRWAWHTVPQANQQEEKQEDRRVSVRPPQRRYGAAFPSARDGL